MNKPPPQNSLPQDRNLLIKNWLIRCIRFILILLFLAGCVYLGAYLTVPGLMSPIFALPPLVLHNAVLLIIFGLIAVHVLIADVKIQRYRLEFTLISLFLLGEVLYVTTPVHPSQNQTSQNQSIVYSIIRVPTPIPTPSYGSFLLPVDKIKTDLKGFQIGENISLWCIVDNAVHIYHMTIADMTGIGNETPNPPYNSGFVKVVVDLNESKVTDFVQDMVKTNAIFVLPSDTPSEAATPTPTPITSSHTYALPLNKLQLSGECLTSGSNFLVLLVTADQQHFSYPVSLTITPGDVCLSKQSSGSNPIVTVTLNNVTLDVANTFNTELSKAAAIYLIQQ